MKTYHEALSPLPLIECVVEQYSITSQYNHTIINTTILISLSQFTKIF